MLRQIPPVDGSWSDWTAWSRCDTNCRKTRNRVCNNPTPLFDGVDCAGNSTEEDTCYGEDCCPGNSEYIGCFKESSLPKIGNYVEENDITPCLCSGFCSLQKKSIAYIYSTDGYKLWKIVLKITCDYIPGENADVQNQLV